MVRREGVGTREKSVLASHPRPDADKEKYQKPISARPPDVKKKKKKKKRLPARHILRLEFSALPLALP